MKYLHTSSAYPGWTVIASAGLPPETLRNVTMALYAISPEEIWHSQWLPATDFARIDKLFKELRFGPYEYLRHWTAERIWKEYSLWILLLPQRSSLAFSTPFAATCSYAGEPRNWQQHQTGSIDWKSERNCSALQHCRSRTAAAYFSRRLLLGGH